VSSIGAGEIVLLLVVALLLFGPSRLPEMARSLGKGVRDFKEAATGLTDPPLPPAGYTDELDLSDDLDDETPQGR
jgi:sec-independent protein translocase protein TatA